MRETKFWFENLIERDHLVCWDIGFY